MFSFPGVAHIVDFFSTSSLMHARLWDRSLSFFFFFICLLSFSHSDTAVGQKLGNKMGWNPKNIAIRTGNRKKKKKGSRKE